VTPTTEVRGSGQVARLARAVVVLNLTLLVAAVGVVAVIGWDGGSEHWVTLQPRSVGLWIPDGQEATS
jgi:hypothetical protein